MARTIITDSADEISPSLTVEVSNCAAAARTGACTHPRRSGARAPQFRFPTRGCVGNGSIISQSQSFSCTQRNALTSFLSTAQKPQLAAATWEMKATLHAAVFGFPGIVIGRWLNLFSFAVACVGFDDDSYSYKAAVGQKVRCGSKQVRSRA